MVGGLRRSSWSKTLHCKVLKCNQLSGLAENTLVTPFLALTKDNKRFWSMKHYPAYHFDRGQGKVLEQRTLSGLDEITVHCLWEAS